MNEPINSIGKVFAEKPRVPQLLKKFLLIPGIRKYIYLLALACLRPLD
jgi:hypothetical protein